jgi:hypothetical protein
LVKAIDRWGTKADIKGPVCKPGLAADDGGNVKVGTTVGGACCCDGEGAASLDYMKGVLTFSL